MLNERHSQPHCIACKGTGKVFIKPGYEKKCICTIIDSKVLQDLLDNRHKILEGFRLKPDTAASVLLLVYFLKDIITEDIREWEDEYKIYKLTTYYGDSFQIMYEKNSTQQPEETQVMPQATALDYKEKECIDCHEPFKPNSGRQIRCGQCSDKKSRRSSTKQNSLQQTRVSEPPHEDTCESIPLRTFFKTGSALLEELGVTSICIENDGLEISVRKKRN